MTIIAKLFEIYPKVKKLSILLLVISIASCSTIRTHYYGYYGTSNYFYSKELNKIFYSTTLLGLDDKNKKEIPADRETFIPINWDFAKDKNKVFFKNIVLKNVDHTSFGWHNELDLPKDKNHLYQKTTNSNILSIVPDIDPQTYERVQSSRRDCAKDWYRDKRYYYYNHKKTDADRATLNFKSPFFPFDKTNIFYIVNDIPVKYTYVGGVTAVNRRMVYDHKYIFLAVGCETSYSKDKELEFRKLTISDYRTFKKYGGPDDRYFSVDKKLYYTWWTLIEGADLNTFKVIDGFRARDAIRVYKYGKVLKGYDPKTYTRDKWGRYPDDPDYGEAPKYSGRRDGGDDDD